MSFLDSIMNLRRKGKRFSSSFSKQITGTTRPKFNHLQVKHSNFPCIILLSMHYNLRVPFLHATVCQPQLFRYLVVGWIARYLEPVAIYQEVQFLHLMLRIFQVLHSLPLCLYFIVFEGWINAADLLELSCFFIWPHKLSKEKEKKTNNLSGKSPTHSVHHMKVNLLKCLYTYLGIQKKKGRTRISMVGDSSHVNIRYRKLMEMQVGF